jgi:eukaryotic-like serine/threonine-protein kinase
MPVGDPSPPSDDPLIGRVLSERYRIVRKIGEGGMGAVYQAEHALIEKKIALKILFQDLTRRPDLVARFLQEAKSASRIGHENVIDISDFGQSPEGLVFIAMEYLEGQDLGRTLKTTGPMHWNRARPILMQITKALRAAHGNGIIHRDMKPENIYLIQREGRPDFVKVLDFGIAKIINPDEADGPRLTQTGMIFGTPEYMSPEQAQGHPPDHRVDVYAVGCIMYHALTGSVPFTADSFMGILTKHLLEPPVPPRQRRPDLDILPDVEAICMKAMEKERDKRFPDMDAFYRALGAAGDLSFEPSAVFVPPRASLKYPNLADPNPLTRESKTAMASKSAASFADERPVRASEAPTKLGSGAKLAVGALVGGVIALVLFLALPRGPKPAPAGSNNVTTAGTTAASATPTAPAPTPPPSATPPAAVTPPPPAAKTSPAATAAEPAPTRPSRSRRRRDVESGGDEAKADPLHRKIPIPAEPTPAELKNPFGATP